MTSAGANRDSGGRSAYGPNGRAACRATDEVEAPVEGKPEIERRDELPGGQKGLDKNVEPDAEAETVHGGLIHHIHIVEVLVTAGFYVCRTHSSEPPMPNVR